MRPHKPIAGAAVTCRLGWPQQKQQQKQMREAELQQQLLLLRQEVQAREEEALQLRSTVLQLQELLCEKQSVSAHATHARVCGLPRPCSHRSRPRLRTPAPTAVCRAAGAGGPAGGTAAVGGGAAWRSSGGGDRGGAERDNGAAGGRAVRARWEAEALPMLPMA